jgi:hypothetical protein
MPITFGTDKSISSPLQLRVISWIVGLLDY